MTREEFSNLNLHDKGDVLFQRGEYTSTRKYYNQNLALYRLFDFWVEVFIMDGDNPKITEIRVLSDEKALKLYTDGIDLNDLI